jgi:hypothetical protein
VRLLDRANSPSYIFSFVTLFSSQSIFGDYWSINFKKFRLLYLLSSESMLRCIYSSWGSGSVYRQPRLEVVCVTGLPARTVHRSCRLFFVPKSPFFSFALNFPIGVQAEPARPGDGQGNPILRSRIPICASTANPLQIKLDSLQEFGKPCYDLHPPIKENR